MDTFVQNITYKYLISQLNTKITISGLSVFATVGLVMPFIPFFVSEITNADAIISFVFLLVVFGIPFGYFIGARNIIKTLKIRSNFKNYKFYISKDVVTDIRVIQRMNEDENLDFYGKLYLEKYSLKKDLAICIDIETFNKISLGDSCILVFCDSSKDPVLVFAGNDYIIDSELSKFIQN